jgi:hypothetical protein
MWFNQVAAVEEPGRTELMLFVRNVREFLGFVLENRKDFDFLWHESPELYDLAWETFRFDIAEGAGLELDRAIANISGDVLYMHGLEGRPLRFKFAVLNSIGNRWGKLGGRPSIREWFKKIVEAIDAILDSLIDAAGGAGGIIKEFKDALMALG